MATHSSILAWRIPGTGEPGGVLSMGSHRVGHNWSDLATAELCWPYSKPSKKAGGEGCVEQRSPACREENSTEAQSPAKGQDHTAQEKRETQDRETSCLTLWWPTRSGPHELPGLTSHLRTLYYSNNCSLPNPQCMSWLTQTAFHATQWSLPTIMRSRGIHQGARVHLSGASWSWCEESVSMPVWMFSPSFPWVKVPHACKDTPKFLGSMQIRHHTEFRVSQLSCL